MQDFVFENVTFNFNKIYEGTEVYTVVSNDIFYSGGIGLAKHPEKDNIIIIIAHEDINTILTPDELSGMMDHELGHVTLNHQKPETKEDFELFEIQADQYAIDKGHRPEVLSSALMKLIHASAARLGLPVEQWLESHHNRLAILARYNTK